MDFLGTFLGTFFIGLECVLVIMLVLVVAVFIFVKPGNTVDTKQDKSKNMFDEVQLVNTE